MLIGKVANTTSASVSVPLDSGIDSILSEATGVSLQWSAMVGSYRKQIIFLTCLISPKSKNKRLAQLKNRLSCI